MYRVFHWKFLKEMVCWRDMKHLKHMFAHVRLLELIRHLCFCPWYPHLTCRQLLRREQMGSSVFMKSKIGVGTYTATRGVDYLDIWCHKENSDVMMALRKQYKLSQWSILNHNRFKCVAHRFQENHSGETTPLSGWCPWPGWCHQNGFPETSGLRV